MGDGTLGGGGDAETEQVVEDAFVDLGGEVVEVRALRLGGGGDVREEAGVVVGMGAGGRIGRAAQAADVVAPVLRLGERGAARASGGDEVLHADLVEGRTRGAWRYGV